MERRDAARVDHERQGEAASERRSLCARWFTTDRIAFSVDFRWYSVAEQAAITGLVAQPRTTLLVLSGGIAIK